jgi:tetratricopeptide (TPR) repeat protein
MNHFNKLVATLCAVTFCSSVFAQPAKPKAPVKAKPAVAAAKIDYEKLKKEIRSLYRDEKHAEVIKKSAPYLLKFPKDTQVVFQNAISHISLKQYAVGFDVLKKFCNNTDTAAKYIAFIGFSVPEKDLLTSGISCAEEAIKISPNGPFGYFVKGGIYSDQADHEKALPVMEKMNTLLRNDEEQVQFGPFYAKELAFNNQPEKALAAIDLLYKKFPKDKETISSYASIYRIDKNYDKALEKIDELINLYPDDMDYKIQKVATLSLSGKKNSACTEIESIIAKDEAYEFMRYRYKCTDYFATPAIADIKTATWEVTSGGSTYDFAVSDIKGTIDSDFEFTWSMTSGDDMKGHITITKDAMEKAVSQNNYFGPSLKNATLTDKTTVWVSKAVMNGLQKDGKATMDVGMGKGEELFTVIPDGIEIRDEASFDEKISIKTTSKYLNTLHIKNEDGSRQLWILNDAANPMIIKMDIGFSIVLKSVE